MGATHNQWGISRRAGHIAEQLEKSGWTVLVRREGCTCFCRAIRDDGRIREARATGPHASFDAMCRLAKRCRVKHAACRKRRAAADLKMVLVGYTDGRYEILESVSELFIVEGRRLRSR